MERVVVTGIGLCAPLDFAAVAAGRCGLRAPSRWSIPGLSLTLGTVPEDVPSLVRDLPGRWRPDRLDPVSQFALVAAQRAREQSGLDDPALDQAAVVVASAMGGELTHNEACVRLALLPPGDRLRLSPFTAAKLMPNAASANVAMLLGAHGPNVAPAAACASGAYAIAQAADLLRLGRARVAVCGASEAPCEEIAARTFLAGEALSPSGRSLPFHRERDGFVLAEGAAVMVLETLDHARSRGARVLAELAGIGLTCDASHIVAPHPDGTYAAAAMRAAIREAGLQPGDVGYVNAHATGTPVGDGIECAAIRAVFGDAPPPVSSTKGATGHLLGAAGALEAAYAVLAMLEGILPPTLHLADGEGADPECAQGLDLVPQPGRRVELKAVLSNSFAFGGHNASLVFTRAPA